MRRFIALSMIAALLSVSSLPLLPGPVGYVHAAERMTDYNDCHNDASGVRKSMDHESMSHGVVVPMAKHQAMAMDKSSHQHAKQLSPAEMQCRIECGCGCNASLDGLPHQLAPHTLAPASELTPPLAVIEPATLALWTYPLTAAPPSPPPKPFSI